MTGHLARAFVDRMPVAAYHVPLTEHVDVIKMNFAAVDIVDGGVVDLVKLADGSGATMFVLV